MTMKKHTICVEASATHSFAQQTTSATAPPVRPRIAKFFATQSGSRLIREHLSEELSAFRTQCFES